MSLQDVSIILDFEGFKFPGKIIYRELSWVHLHKNLSDSYNIYTPGILYKNLNPNDQRTVRFCTHQLTGLFIADKPQKYGKWKSSEELKAYLLSLYKEHGCYFGFKGGDMEKILLEELGIPFIDIEKLGVPKSSKIGRIKNCRNHIGEIKHYSLCDVNLYKYAIKNKIFDL